MAGLLTSAAGGVFRDGRLRRAPAGPAVRRRRVILVGLAVLTRVWRSAPTPGSTALFLLLSVVALAGIAVVNVLLPVIVKERFPDQVGTMTGLYSVALNVGATAAAAATVPLTGAVRRTGGSGWPAGRCSRGRGAAWLPLARDRGAGRPGPVDGSSWPAARSRGRWPCTSACSPPRRT